VWTGLKPAAYLLQFFDRNSLDRVFAISLFAYRVHATVSFNVE